MLCFSCVPSSWLLYCPRSTHICRKGVVVLVYSPTDTTPGRSATAPLAPITPARFRGYGTNDEIPTQLLARNGSVVRLNTSTDQIGTWPTSGDQYLYVVAYDWSGKELPW